MEPDVGQRNFKLIEHERRATCPTTEKLRCLIEIELLSYASARERASSAPSASKAKGEKDPAVEIRSKSHSARERE